jgi:hypothetical protein
MNDVAAELAGALGVRQVGEGSFRGSWIIGRGHGTPPRHLAQSSRL